jgi:hypothetical protein
VTKPSSYWDRVDAAEESVRNAMLSLERPRTKPMTRRKRSRIRRYDARMRRLRAQRPDLVREWYLQQTPKRLLRGPERRRWLRAERRRVNVVAEHYAMLMRVIRRVASVTTL